jgi:adenylosuccinate synthase
MPWLEGYEPEYIEMDGWMQILKAIRQFDMPAQAQAYVHCLEGWCRHPSRLSQVGPERSATIRVK